MKKSEVQVGGVYTAKVSDKIVEVRIDGENRHGGWNATNLATGRKVRIKSAQRLRRVAHEPRRADCRSTLAEAATTTEPPAAMPVAEPQHDKAHRATLAALPKNALPKKMSGLDAAAKVLEESDHPMNAGELLEAIEAKGYWRSPGGKTPSATLYTAVTMLPKTWQSGIDCFPRTGCARRMGRGGGRRNSLTAKGLKEAVSIRRG